MHERQEEGQPEFVVTLAPPPVVRPRHPLRMWLVRIMAVFLLVTVGPVVVLRWIPPLTSAFMLERQLGLLVRGEDPAIRYRWVAWREISRPMRLAVVAAEDQRFPTHFGFDLHSIADAAEDNPGRRLPRGASTISQQVAKNLFLWPGRSWVRKGLEAYFTVLMEAVWPKRRVLEVYLNVAEFGDRTYGVGAAGDAYFSKPPLRITRREAAVLAAVLPNPQRFRADRPSPYIEGRAGWIEQQMRGLGDDYLAALEPPVRHR
jgi:monofunctional biosynthetic peptidoglycan transglycosylase